MKPPLRRATRDDLESLAASRGTPPAEPAIWRLLAAPPSAEDVRRWWAGLRDAHRERLVAAAPLLVGNLNGVPWPARSRANHRTLEAHLARLVLAGGASGRRLEHLVSRLRELRTGRGFFDRPDGTPRFLLAYDPEHHAVVEYLGTAIAETDDPWASPLAPGVVNLGVFVPGNDSTLADFEGKAHTMSEVVSLSEPGEAGMVVWQGGRFPHGPFALASSAAERLAVPFGSFVNAIPRDARVTVTAFGFSFGGAVVGQALRRGMVVDRVVHVSSAGLGAGIRSLDDLPETARVPHYALMAPGDTSVGPILGLDVRLGPLGRLGHGPNPLTAPGVTRLETGFLQHVPPGGDLAEGRRSGLLIGHTAILERWGTTAKHGMNAAMTGGRAELAAPRTRVERAAERLALPVSPIMRPDYAPRFIKIG